MRTPKARARGCNVWFTVWGEQEVDEGASQVYFDLHGNREDL
jgi:hypothetical protein